MPVRSRLCSGLLLALALAPQAASAQERVQLPDMGSSAESVFTSGDEANYGAMVYRELRRLGWTLDDPLLQDYLRGLAFRLVSHSDDPRQAFTFFIVRSRDINAASWPGGYIHINAGLMLTAEREDELAGVLAHEIAHTTQRHLARAMEAAKRDSLPILLGMLGAVVAAQGSSSSGDAAQAAVVGGMSLLQQRQINYTRSNEHEADRIGIRTLADAGFDPAGMADFFGRMLRASRGMGGESVPEYLRTHPVTTTRISEAKDRAEATASAHAVAGEVTLAHPLLPQTLQAALPAGMRPDSGTFPWARERLRVLTAPSAVHAAEDYRRAREAAPEATTDAQRYGEALALANAGQLDAALVMLDGLSRRHPDQLWVQLALAETLHRAGREQPALQGYERLLAQHSGHRAVILSFTRILNERGTADAGQRAQGLLRPLLVEGSDDPWLQAAFARASELAGDLVRAGEAHAEVAFLNGRAEDALKQLERLKQRDDLDYYQRARIESRIAAITPTALEERKRSLRGGERGSLQDARAAAWAGH